MLHQRLKGEPHTRLRYQCSPHHINSALHPVIRQLEFAARFAPDDTAERKLDKLESLLAQSFRAMADVMPLFAVLLSVPTGDRYSGSAPAVPKCHRPPVGCLNSNIFLGLSSAYQLKN